MSGVDLSRCAPYNMKRIDKSSCLIIPSTLFGIWQLIFAQENASLLKLLIGVQVALDLRGFSLRVSRFTRCLYFFQKNSSYTISSIYATISDETKRPRTKLRPLFTNKLLKVATRRHFLSSLGIFFAKFPEFFLKWTIT